ncbi:hypothetical protein LTR15_004102 [Elasticomyces elasticus]|nr:hypothetical protein LTR15_004102 [Elasticomyces elasticus]
MDRGMDYKGKSRTSSGAFGAIGQERAARKLSGGAVEESPGGVSLGKKAVGNNGASGVFKSPSAPYNSKAAYVTDDDDNSSSVTVKQEDHKAWEKAVDATKERVKTEEYVRLKPGETLAKPEPSSGRSKHNRDTSTGSKFTVHTMTEHRGFYPDRRDNDVSPRIALASQQAEHRARAGSNASTSNGTTIYTPASDSPMTNKAKSRTTTPSATKLHIQLVQDTPPITGTISGLVSADQFVNFNQLHEIVSGNNTQIATKFQAFEMKLADQAKLISELQTVQEKSIGNMEAIADVQQAFHGSLGRVADKMAFNTKQISDLRLSMCGPHTPQQAYVMNNHPAFTHPGQIGVHAPQSHAPAGMPATHHHPQQGPGHQGRSAHRTRHHHQGRNAPHAQQHGVGNQYVIPAHAGNAQHMANGQHRNSAQHGYNTQYAYDPRGAYDDGQYAQSSMHAGPSSNMSNKQPMSNHMQQAMHASQQAAAQHGYASVSAMPESQSPRIVRSGTGTMTTPNPGDDVFAPDQRPDRFTTPTRPAEVYTTSRAAPAEFETKGYTEILHSTFVKAEYCARTFMIVSVGNSTKDRNAPVQDLIKSIGFYLDNIPQARYLLEKAEFRTAVITGYFNRRIGEEILTNGIFSYYPADLWSTQYAAAWDEEQRVLQSVADANNYELRQAHAENRARIAKMMSTLPGFQQWIKDAAGDLTQLIFKEVAFLCHPVNHPKALAALHRAVLEAFKIGVRMRQEAKLFECVYYRYGCRWDHQQMVQRNEEMEGLACDETPPIYVVRCTMAPKVVEKSFVSGQMFVDVLHKGEVILCDRKTNLR